MSTRAQVGLTLLIAGGITTPVFAQPIPWGRLNCRTLQLRGLDRGPGHALPMSRGLADLILPLSYGANQIGHTVALGSRSATFNIEGTSTQYRFNFIVRSGGAPRCNPDGTLTGTVSLAYAYELSNDEFASLRIPNTTPALISREVPLGELTTSNSTRIRHFENEPSSGGYTQRLVLPTVNPDRINACQQLMTVANAAYQRATDAWAHAEFSRTRRVDHLSRHHRPIPAAIANAAPEPTRPSPDLVCANLPAPATPTAMALEYDCELQVDPSQFCQATGSSASMDGGISDAGTDASSAHPNHENLGMDASLAP